MTVCACCGVPTSDDLGHRIPCACSTPPITASSPMTVIRERIEDLQGQRARYLAYQADRVREGDNHAVWDSAIDISLCDYEIKGLEFAMKALGVEL